MEVSGEAQLVLDLGAEPRFGREDFLPAPSNAAALAAIEEWPGWPDPVLLLRGAAGSGKSHLGAIWANRAGAAIVPAAAVMSSTLDDLERKGALLIEDMDVARGDERVLFHVMNAARVGGHSILMTAQSGPSEWGIKLPDLFSRLRLAPCVSIVVPDDGLVRAVLVKLLTDRQLVVDTVFVDYAARNLGRSLADARRFVDLVDRRSLSASRRITRSIAADALAEIVEAREDWD